MRITTARTIVAIGVTTAACLAGGLAVASASTAPAPNTAPVVQAPQTVQDGSSDDAVVDDNNAQNDNADQGNVQDGNKDDAAVDDNNGQNDNADVQDGNKDDAAVGDNNGANDNADQGNVQDGNNDDGGQSNG